MRNRGPSTSLSGSRYFVVAPPRTPAESRPPCRRRTALQRVVCGPRLAAGDGPDDEKRLRPGRDDVREGGVRRLMGEIPLAREESQERSTLLRDVVADRPSQHRIAGL